jgi:cysteine-rich repeat protein
MHQLRRPLLDALCTTTFFTGYAARIHGKFRVAPRFCWGPARVGRAGLLLPYERVEMFTRRLSPNLLLLCMAAGLALVFAANAQADRNPEAKSVRCRYKIAKGLMGLAKKQMRARGECAQAQAAGMINSSTVDCSADPTNSYPIDYQLARVARRAHNLGRKIADRCDAPFRSPADVQVDQLCDPPVTNHDWERAVDCGYKMVTDAADRLFDLTYRRDADRAMETGERTCRAALDEVVRMVFRSRLVKRVDCFRRVARTGYPLRCLATNAWPGRVESTGWPEADEALGRAMRDLRTTAGVCGAGIDNMRLSDPPLEDYTGGEFTSEDLFNVLADAALKEESLVVAKMFPSLPFCGDGVVDSAHGEECDDGNVEPVQSCDGCDRDCTSSFTCQNGAACGANNEVCDDGNDVAEDGCNPTCQMETCGDAITQPGLGEGCDDGNAVDCDGCDTNCTASALCNNGVTCAGFGEQCDQGLGTCLSGFDELAPCASDVDCRGECSTGRNTGAPCATNTDCSTDQTSFCIASTGCGGVCAGGRREGKLCQTDGACPGSCRPATGQGQMCNLDVDCPAGMQCNASHTCFLPRQGIDCFNDGACGTGGVCEPSGGCKLGNSNTAGDHCRDNCTLPRCGDGATDPNTTAANRIGGEQCDDGNLNDLDGCDSNCTLPSCGNGVADTGEDCDLGSGTCTGGFDAGEACLYDVECRGVCSHDASIACRPDSAIIDCSANPCIPASGCSGGNSHDPTCRPNCTTPRCGDGVADPGEQCDAGPGVCASGPDQGAACDADANCRGVCTTGMATNSPCLSDDDCAPGTCQTTTCTGGNSDGAANACREDCTLPSCGDGVRDAGEQCDGADGGSCLLGCQPTCVCIP